MPGEKYTVSLIARTKEFVRSMTKATKAMKLMGDMNRGIIKNMQKMSSAATKGGARFGQNVQKLKTGMDKTRKSTAKSQKGWKKYFKTLAAGAGVIGTVIGSLLLLRKAFNAAADAAAIDVQAKAFANLAASYGESSAMLLKGLRDASKNTVDNLQLMTTASRAILLGIPITGLVEMMEVARGASKAMGTTVSGAFSDIALGIGRQSRLILDNLGIIVRVGTAYATYAAEIGTTADALTDVEKKQAFFNAGMEAGRDNASRAATGLIDFQDRIAQLQTAMVNLGRKMKTFVLAAFITLDKFMQESGFSTSLKTLFEVTIPELLLNRMEFILYLLEKLDTVVKSINEEGFTQTAKNIAKDTGDAILKENEKWANKWLSRFKAIFTGETIYDEPSRIAVSPAEQQKYDARARKKGEDPGALDPLVAKAKAAREFFLKTIAELQAAQDGFATPTKTSMEQIAENIERLGTAFGDVQIGAQDMEQEFSIRLKAIKKHIENIQSIEGPMQPEVLAKQKALLDPLVKKYKEFQEIMLKDVKPESFLAGIGVLSDKEFTRKAAQGLAKLSRILKEDKIGDPKQLRKAYDTLLKEVLDNVDRLTPELKKKFLEINAWMAENAVPADTITMGLNQWVDDYKNVSNRMQTIGKQTAQAISSAFENFFFNSVTGKLKSLRETFAAFGTSILKSVSKALGDKATQELLGIFGFGGNTTAVDNNTDAVNQNTAALLLKTGGGLGTGAAAMDPVVLASLKATGAIPGFSGTGTGTGTGIVKAGIDEAKVKEKSTSVTISVLDKVKKSMHDIYGKFSTFMGDLFKGVTGLFSGGGSSGIAGSVGGKAAGGLWNKISGAFKSGGKLGGIGSFFGGIGGAIGKLWPFAQGGITSLAGSLSGAMMTSKPSMAAISETGKREAIVPLEKFAELIQQPSVTINAVDSKSFQQYINENKEILFGAINSVRSPQNVGQMASGPF